MSKQDLRVGRTRRTVRVAALLGLIVVPSRIQATQTVVPLLPGTTTIDLTIYAMGLFGLPAHFTRFSGSLRVDPDTPADCRVSVQIEAASLQMEDAGRARLATGPNLLDAARYPQLSYAGSCAGGQAEGALSLHGVTRKLTLTAIRDGDRIEATGTIRRGDFGIDGLPGMIGRTIKLRFTAQLPPGLAARIDP